MNDIMIAHGKSTSGTDHSLEIVPLMSSDKGSIPKGYEAFVLGFKMTVLGPKGKRHASVKINRDDAERIIYYLQTALEEK